LERQIEFAPAGEEEYSTREVGFLTQSRKDAKKLLGARQALRLCAFA